MRLYRHALLSLFTMVAVALAAGPAPFVDGDTVCLIGDSITHGGLYHSYVEIGRASCRERV